MKKQFVAIAIFLTGITGFAQTITIDFGSEFQVDYLQPPVLAKFYLLEELRIQAGPKFSLKLNKEAYFDLFKSIRDIDFDALNDFDLQPSEAAAYKFNFGLFVEARDTL